MFPNGEDIPGVLLTADSDNPRARLRVTPILSRKTNRTVALRVRVFTELGLEIVNARVNKVEVTKIEVPGPDLTLKRYPGTFHFYGDRDHVAFLSDMNAGALQLPLAAETPRKGPDAL